MRRCTVAILTALIMLDTTLASAQDTHISLSPKDLPPHPRLFLTPERWAGVQQRIKSDPPTQAIARALTRYADALLNIPPLERRMQGRRLLGVSRDALKRIGSLAMVAKLTGDDRYLRRAVDEMRAVASFEDWNPAHYLDTGEMTLAMAMGYDWLHDRLSPEDRQLIKTAILEKGVRTSYVEGKTTWWIKGTNNWNQVCHAGIVAGALAVAEDEPELASRTVRRAVEHLPLATRAYAPDGACNEGPTYWSYGASFHVVLLDALETVLGTDFGLTRDPGLLESGRYRALVVGPTGAVYNYADARPMEHHEIEPALFWIGQRLGDPSLASRVVPDRAAALKRFENPRGNSQRLMPLALIWAAASEASDPGDAAQPLPLHWTAGGTNPISIHRSAWDDPKALFIGIKGGKAALSHGHMDAGSFVLESDGVRWAIDLGMQEYSRLEGLGVPLWDARQDGGRWDLFALGVQSHNTLVFNGHRTLINGHAEIVRFSDAEPFPHTVVDLSAVYAEDAKRVMRGLAVLPGKRVLIQDEWTIGPAPAGIAWQMLTNAKVTIDGKRAVLEQDGQTLQIDVLGDLEATLCVEEGETLRQPYDEPLPEARRLSILLQSPAGQSKMLRVLLTPGKGPVDRSVPEQPLESWSAPR